METDTFPKENVQKAFSRLVAAKIDKTRDEKSFKQMKGTGVPLIVLLDPTGKERARSAGKPQGDLLDALANDMWNVGVKFSNDGKSIEAFQEWAPIVDLFPDSQMAAQAKENIARWESDPALKAQIDELRAKWFCGPALKAWDRLNSTKAKKDPKSLDEAKANLEKIVSDFPSTPFAAQAQERLDKLAPKK